MVLNLVCLPMYSSLFGSLILVYKEVEGCPSVVRTPFPVSNRLKGSNSSRAAQVFIDCIPQDVASCLQETLKTCFPSNSPSDLTLETYWRARHNNTQNNFHFPKILLCCELDRISPQQAKKLTQRILSGGTLSS